MTSTQKISVIIPTHNRPDTVIAAVRSVLAQTWRDLELFVIDVGVKDRAEDALREFSSDPRFHYVKHPVELRGGAARNIGAKLAQGQWLAFLDDDDEWFPKKLEIQMEAISRASHDVGFCFSGVVNDFGDRQEITRVLAGEQDLSELAFARFKGFLTVTLMIRRDVYAAVGGFDEMLPSHQDPELILRIAQRWRGLGVDQPLVSVNMHPGRDHVGGDLGRRIEGRKMVLQKHAAEYAKRPAILARHWFQIGLWERERGKYTNSKCALKKSFRIHRSFRTVLHLGVVGMYMVCSYAFLCNANFIRAHSKFLRHLRIILPFVGASTILSILFLKIDLGPLFDLFSTVEYPMFLIGLLVLFFAHAFTILRWQDVLRLIGYDLKTGIVARAYLANLPITKVTPAFSGDFVRSFFIKEQVPVSIGSGGIFLEAMLDISILFVSILAGAFWTGAIIQALISTLVIVGMIYFTYFSNTSWVRSMLERSKLALNFFSAIQLAYKNPGTTLRLSVLTFFSWMGTVVFLWCIFAALGENVPLAAIFFLQPFAVLAGLLPITVSGVGVRESAMLVLYVGVAGSSTVLFVGLAYSLVTALIFPLLCVPFTIAAISRLSKLSK